MNWRLHLATALLLLGVGLAGSGTLWWILLGYLCLLFVPALIIDAARPHWRHRPRGYTRRGGSAVRE